MIPGEFYYKKYLFNNNFSEKVRMIRYILFQGSTMLVLLNGSRGDGYCLLSLYI
jgi:hypothetical protein